MQIKTIEKNITNKVEEWLLTITNEWLRKKIKDNTIVTGGCIASMLLNEKVNDYDIYIKDVDVLLELVKYYTKDYDKIIILDGRYKQNLLKEVGITDESINYEESNFAYGIAIKNLKEDQIKLFFTDKNGGIKVNDDKPKEELNYTPLFFSPNAISLSNNLQIVIRFHGNTEEIHKNFDFVHATNYFTFETGLVNNNEALESIITKQLRYQGSLYPLTSIIRMKKFIKRNWNINAGEILKIMFQISELDLKDPNVLEEQLIGVDIAYFSTLISILRQLKNDKLDSATLNEIIDKVFNSSEDRDEE